MSHYDELGVRKDATRDEIRRAYRRKAQKAHPDKGGDPQKFYAIQKAYDVLGDDRRRGRYDASGEDGERGTLRQQAVANLASMFSSFVDSDKSDVRKVDFIDVMRQVISHENRKIGEAMDATAAAIRKRESALARLVHKGKGENFLALVLIANNEKDRRSIEAMKEQLAVHAEMSAVLTEYEYPTEKEPPGFDVRRGPLWSGFDPAFGADQTATHTGGPGKPPKSRL